MLSALQLDAYYLERLQIEVNPKQPEGAEDGSLEETYSIQFKPEIKQAPDALQFMVFLSVDCKGDRKKAKFKRIRVDLRGFFSLPGDTPQELVEQFIGLNGFAILYGIMRGIVSQVTGPTVCGSYLLPTLNLVEALQPNGKEGGSPEANTDK